MAAELAAPKLNVVAERPALRVTAPGAARLAIDPAMPPDQIRVSPATRPERRPIAPADDKKVTAPGEGVRNKLSIFGMVAGPLVMIQQGVDMVGDLTFRNPLFQTVAQPLVRAANIVGRIPILSKPLVQSGLTKIGRALPFLGATLLVFDGYAAVRTLTTKDASDTRKFLTVGRFAMGAITCGINFIPRVGMVAGIIPGLIGNVFEFALMKRNAQGKN